MYIDYLTHLKSCAWHPKFMKRRLNALFDILKIKGNRKRDSRLLLKLKMISLLLLTFKKYPPNSLSLITIWNIFNFFQYHCFLPETFCLLLYFILYTLYHNHLLFMYLGLSLINILHYTGSIYIHCNLYGSFLICHLRVSIRTFYIFREPKFFYISEKNINHKITSRCIEKSFIFRL